MMDYAGVSAILQEAGNLHFDDLLCAPEDTDWFLLGTLSRVHVDPFLLRAGTSVKLAPRAVRSVATALRTTESVAQAVRGTLEDVYGESGRIRVVWGGKC